LLEGGKRVPKCVWLRYKSDTWEGIGLETNQNSDETGVKSILECSRVAKTNQIECQYK